MPIRSPDLPRSVLDHDLAEHGLRRKSFATGGVILTFDDGLGGHYDNAFPAMKPYGYKGVLYLPVDWMGAGGDPLTDAEILEMVDAGWEVGSHTANHGYRTSEGGTCVKEVDYQWRESCKKIQEKYYTFPITGAYPGGSHNAMIDAIASRYLSVLCVFGYGPSSPYWNVKATVAQQRWGVNESNYQDGKIANGLNYAQTNKTFVVYAFHNVLASGASGDNINKSSLEWICTQIANSGLPVYTFKELAEKYGLSLPLINEIPLAGLDIWVKDVASLPTASAAYRGNLIRVQGGSGVADQLYICRKLADDSYTWTQITT